MLRTLSVMFKYGILEHRVGAQWILWINELDSFNITEGFKN